MNTTTIRAAVAAVGIGLAAAATAPTAAADADTLDELAFVTVLAEEGIYYPSEDSVIGTGYGICDLLDEGGSFADALWYARADGYRYEPGYVVGASTAAFCPRHNDIATASPTSRWVA